jgi:NDP-sugar pyrophosphorylase family protein
MKALILCAGKGSRLGYKTKPKCMAMVNGKPILEHLVNHLNKYGITEIIVNVHQDYDKIFKYFGTRLLYLYEPTLLGESATEQLLQNWLGMRYIVMNGDTLTNVNLKKMMDSPNSIAFVKGIKYAGTKCYWGRVLRRTWQEPWDGDGAYYFDCGTKAKLAKARKFFKK